MLSLLLTLWQSDSAFPNGGFAFSNGIEGLSGLGQTLDRCGLASVLASTLTHRWATADRRVLMQAFEAADDPSRLFAVDNAFEAATLPAPLRLGSCRNGLAFLTAHARIGTSGAAALKSAVMAQRTPGHLPVMQGAVWRACGLDLQMAVLASGYGAAAAMVGAAVRLGEVGAVEAQQSLQSVLPLIAELAVDSALDQPLDDPDEVASMSPWLDIAAMRHATAEIRLFSN